VREGEHPLDRTAVHPERYDVVETMATDLGVPVAELVGNPALVASVDFSRFVDAAEGLGQFTLNDIRQELERPGRDPRPEFEVPSWRDDVTSLEDLEVGMSLEGRVSNVTNFGAFVDIGVKRDGLVHLSELSHQWIDDPRQAVTVGQIVKVKVMEVDRERGRVGLSIKALLPEPAKPTRAPRDGGKGGGKGGGGKGGGNDRGPQRPATLEDLARKFNRRR
jgi:protein Tex